MGGIPKGVAKLPVRDVDYGHLWATPSEMSGSKAFSPSSGEGSRLRETASVSSELYKIWTLNLGIMRQICCSSLGRMRDTKMMGSMISHSPLQFRQISRRLWPLVSEWRDAYAAKVAAESELFRELFVLFSPVRHQQQIS